MGEGEGAVGGAGGTVMGAEVVAMAGAAEGVVREKVEAEAEAVMGDEVREEGGGGERGWEGREQGGWAAQAMAVEGEAVMGEERAAGGVAAAEKVGRVEGARAA